MLQRVLIATVSLLACTAMLVQADPKDDIQSAAQKLADSANYTWSTTTQGGFGRGTREGKTQNDGLAWFSFKTRDGDSYEILVKGDKSATKTPDGWKSGAEISAAANNDDGGGPPSPERMISMMITNFKTPAAQAKDLDGKLQNLQKTDDAYTADLTPDAAKQMLMFRPRPAATTAPDPNAPQMDVTNAKGSIKLWITDGVLTKMEVHLTGTISFNGNDRDVDRTTTTEIKDVGATKIDVPDEAKAKLAS